jgi:cytosine permease
VVLFGFTFFSATMMAGGELGNALGFSSRLLAALVVGNLLLATYASALAVVAFRSGLSTVLMARFGFGREGSRLADLLLGLTQIGWYAWGTDTVARILIQTFDLPESWDTALVVVCGFGFCLTAAIGYKGLEVLSAVMVPLMTGMIICSAYLALEGSTAAPSAGSGTMSFSQAVTIVVGTFVSGATQSTNWTRYSRSASAAVGVTFLAFFLGNGMMVGYGALAGAVYANSDVVAVLLLQGFFWSAVFMLLSNIWTTQDNTIYNFSLAGCHFFRSNKRRQVTLVGALIGTLLALFGFAELLVPFLLALGTAIPPLGGVVLADFFVCRRGRFPALNEASSWRFGGIVAYGGGVAAAWFLPGIPPVTGIVVAFLLQAGIGWRSGQ